MKIESCPKCARCGTNMIHRADCYVCPKCYAVATENYPAESGERRRMKKEADA